MADRHRYKTLSGGGLRRDLFWAPPQTPSTSPRTANALKLLLQRLGLLQPENGIARSAREAETITDRIGFPVVIRPSYVLGGRAMRSCDGSNGYRYMQGQSACRRKTRC